jgi:hypothetical protein
VTQQRTSGDSVVVPGVVGRYAAYLCARTHVTPQTAVDGDQAVVRVSIDDAVLVLAFRCSGKNEWSLRSAEVQRGTQTAAFTRGQLARATAVLLGHEPLTPACPDGRDRHAD